MLRMSGIIPLLLQYAFMVWTPLYFYLVVLYAFLHVVKIFVALSKFCCVYTDKFSWNRLYRQVDRYMGEGIGGWMGGSVDGWQVANNGLMGELISIFIFIYTINVGFFNLNPWKMKPLCSWKMLVIRNLATQHNILEELGLSVTKGWRRSFFIDQWNCLSTMIGQFVM